MKPRIGKFTLESEYAARNFITKCEAEGMHCVYWHFSTVIHIVTVSEATK